MADGAPDTIRPLGSAAGTRPRGRHIAIIAPPTAGHLNPLQVLGTELVRLGHRVTFVHVADAAPLITEPCLGFVPLHVPASASPPLSAFLRSLAKPTGPVGLGRMIRATAGMTEALLAGAPATLERIGAEAIIADAAEAAGPLVAGRIGIPHMVSVTGLPLMGEPDVPPPFLGWRYRPGRRGRFHNRGGYAVADLLMRPITRVLRRRRREWRLAEEDDALLHVAQCPREFDYPRSALPPRFFYGSPWRAAPGRDVELEHDGRPLIFCSLGTLQGRRRGLFATMAQACAAVGARAVIGHGGGLTPGEERALPGDPLVRAFWPQEAVLRHCAAAVLHGGFNSVLDALAAGIPVVALPIAFEQPGTAARLEWVGAGRAIPSRRVTVGSLAAALEEVTAQSSYRDAARRLSRSMAAAGGARQAAARISAALSGSPAAAAGATRASPG